MAATPNSNVIVENVAMLFNAFLPVDTRRDVNHLYSTIGVKSHGTIHCMMNFRRKNFYFYCFSFFFFKLSTIDQIEPNLFVLLPTHLYQTFVIYSINIGVMK